MSPFYWRNWNLLLNNFCFICCPTYDVFSECSGHLQSALQCLPSGGGGTGYAVCFDKFFHSYILKSRFVPACTLFWAKIEPSFSFWAASIITLISILPMSPVILLPSLPPSPLFFNQFFRIFPSFLLEFFTHIQHKVISFSFFGSFFIFSNIFQIPCGTVSAKL